MSLVRRYGDTDFITGLRLLAVLMVLVHHTNAFTQFGLFGRNFTRSGDLGVTVFFVISGFTIAKTFTDSPSYGHFLTRRLFRITPLYYACLFAGVVLYSTGQISPSKWLEEFGGQVGFYNIAMHLSFLSFLDYRIADSILSVEWSIPIEVFWYLLLPLFLARLGTASGFATVFAGLLFLDVLYNIAAILYFKENSVYVLWWTPIPYFFYFLAGAGAYFLRGTGLEIRQGHRRLAVYLAIFLFGYVVFFRPVFLSVSGPAGITFDAIPLVAGFAVFVMLAAFREETFPLLRRLLTGKPALLLGSVSYSIYLTHFLVVSALKQHFPVWENGGVWLFVLALGLSVGISLVTYRLIEQPTNRLGRRVADRYFGVGDAAPAPNRPSSAR